MNNRESECMRVLMVSPVNYGPENMDGTKKILFNILKRNPQWKVDFLSFFDVEVDCNLKNVTNYFVKNNYKINGLDFLKYPWLLRKYNLRAFEKEIPKMLLKQNYDVIVLVTGVMAKVVSAIPDEYLNSTILLAVDSMSLFWQRRVDSADLFKRYVFNLQLNLWKRYEKTFYNTFQKVIFVSNVDKMFCEKIVKGVNAVAIENGVDTDFFKFEGKYVEENSLIFTGNMTYSPNVQAVHFLVEKIYPKLNQELDNIKIYIVGIGAEKFKVLYPRAGVIYQDYVENLSEYLLKAKVYVSPLMQGAGIKNKILEAMAMGKLIVASPISFDGIEGIEEGDVWIANNESEYIDYIKNCMQFDKKKSTIIGERLSKLIQDRYSWNSIAKRYHKCFVEVSNK